jgi:hypothetical protein
MGVDKARQERVAGSIVTNARGVTTLGVANGQNLDDAPCIDCKGETFFGSDCGLDADGPSRTNQGVDRMHRQVERSQKRRASIASRQRLGATAAKIRVLEFALVFWALGCVLGVMQEPHNRSSALPENLCTSSTFGHLRAAAGAWRAGPYFIERK